MMKLRPVLAGLFLAGVVAGWLGTASASAAEKVPSDRLLPPHVTAYVSIPSVPELKARWKDTLMGQLRDDRALADFWRDVEAELDKFSTELEKQLGVTVNELAAVPSGEIAFALVQPPGKDFAVVGLLDYGDSEKTVEQLLDKAKQSLLDQGAKRSVDETADTPIVVYTLADAAEADEDEEAEPGATKAERKIAYFTKDSHLVAGNDVATLQAVLARWDGKHTRTFADNDVYRYIVDRTKSGTAQPAVSWYVDPVSIATRAITASGGANFQAQMFLGFMPTLGITKLKGLGGSFDFATDEYDSVSRTHVYVEFPTTGVLSALQFPAREQTPPKWVSDKTTSYFALNWDVSEAYDAVEALVDSFQGPGALGRILEGVANQQGGPMLHPKKDFIDQLNGQIHIVTDLPNPDEPETQRVLIALGAKDPTKMQGALASLGKLPDFPAKPREFRGVPIYEVPLPGAFGQQQEGQFAVAVAQDHLMMTSNVTLLEEVIRADQDQKPLAESDDYKRIKAKIPAKTSILGYQKQDAQVRTIYELLRSGGAAGFIEGIDFTKLPPFEDVQKYLPPTGSYAVPDKLGVFFVSFSLRSSKE